MIYHTSLAQCIMLCILPVMTEDISCTGSCIKRNNNNLSCMLEKYNNLDTRLFSPAPIYECTNGPSQPTDFNATVMYQVDKSGAELKYTWRNPDDSSIRDLIGYEFTVSVPDASPPYTLIYRIMVNSSFKDPSLSYRVLCNYKEPSINKRIDARVVSLPPCANNPKMSTHSLYVTISSEKSAAKEVKTTVPTENKGQRSTLIIIVVVISVVAAAVISSVVWYYKCRRIKRQHYGLNHADQGHRPSTNTRSQENSDSAQRRNEHHSQILENNNIQSNYNGIDDACPIHGFTTRNSNVAPESDIFYPASRVEENDSNSFPINSHHSNMNNSALLRENITTGDRSCQMSSNFEPNIVCNRTELSMDEKFQMFNDIDENKTLS